MDKYFNESEIEFIISSDKVSDYEKNKLNIKTKDLFEYLISKKIAIYNIKNMILDYPRLLTFSIETIKERYKNIEKIFKKKTNKLLIANSRILSRENEFLNNRVKYFKDLELSENKIKKIFLDCPTLLTISTLNLDISISNLEDKIEDRQMLIKLISSTSSILSHSNKNINEKFDWFYKKGYDKKQTATIVSKAERILTMSFKEETLNQDSNIEKKYKYLSETLKYTKEEIISITYRFPEYYTLSTNTIKMRIKNLLKLGFNENIIKIIVYNYPKILSFKIDTLNKKYNYYLQLDMLEIFVKNPSYLMQGIDLTNARYQYLINKGLEVNKNNYGKLFLTDKKFKKTYGIGKEELLKKYKEGEQYEQRTNNRIKK